MRTLTFILLLLAVAASSASANVTITTSTLPGGTVGIPYSATILTSGGCTPMTWKISAGSLPLGVTSKPSTDTRSLLLSGTPTAAATYPFTAMVTGCGKHTATKQYSVTVSVAQTVAVVISPVSVSLFTGGTQQFTATVTGTTNTAVTWSTTGGTVSANGLYAAPTTPGTYTVTATSQADTTKSASATATVAVLPSHTVDLTWSDSDPSVIGYNVYRGTASGGPYTKINTGGLIAAMLYTDATVANSTTYYYVATAVNNAGAESGYSNEAQAVVH